MKRLSMHVIWPVCLCLAPTPALGASRSPQAVTLPAHSAQLSGAVRLESDSPTGTVHFWNRLDDKISWHLPRLSSGDYNVVINYSLPAALAGSSFDVIVGGSKVPAVTRSTGGWSNYRSVSIGVVRIGRKSPRSLELVARKLPEVSQPAMPDVAWVSLTPVKPGQAQGFRSLFDGRNLSGWSGDTSVFQVRDGAVVGGSLSKGLSRNEFLASDEDFSDFELRLKMRLVGKGAKWRRPIP